jgi:lipopolysaccharide/colanic/teichoic acid biosynthesis glycosyltransferase
VLNSPYPDRNHVLVPRATGVECASPRVYDRFKSVFDFALAAVMLAASVPVVAAAALLIRATSRGPAIYTQTRLGLGGRWYRIYKLRTMYHDCEAKSGVRWAKKGDTRVTPVGRFLRATHIDELPQLWNVLKGDMSLIGPRPERPEIAERLAEHVPDYYARNAVKPGITGLAQILLPPDTDLGSVRRKLTADREYIRRRTWSLDLLILVGTVLHVAKIPATWILWILALPVDREVVEAGMAASAPAPDLPPEAVVMAARLRRGERTAAVPTAEVAPAQGVAG